MNSMKRPLSIKTSELQMSRLAARFATSSYDGEASDQSFDQQLRESMLDLIELDRDITDYVYESSISEPTLLT